MPVGSRRIEIRVVALVAGLGLAGAVRGADAPKSAPLPSDNVTFRPTVIVVRGTSQGSGTVIASEPGETLVLTAAHVLEAEGRPSIEIHRYNLGLERRRPAEGWPKRVAARVVALDRAADLAILRVDGFETMPFVARVAGTSDEPPTGALVVSLGIDRGAKLASWHTRVLDLALIDMEKGGGDRPFLLTEKFPDFGRSGGGLFQADGTVVGVCVGRAEVVRGRRVGIFASSQSIHRLLRESKLDVDVARSMARRLPRSRGVERTRGEVPTPDPPAPMPAPPRPGPTGR